MKDTTHNPETDDHFAVLALHSALRRRGIAATDGDLPASVQAEHSGHRIIVHHADGRWWRPMHDAPHVTVPVARSGDEHALARDLVAELLGRL